MKGSLNKVNKRTNPFKIFLAFFFSTIICIVLTLLGIIWVMEKGPSKTATAKFCQSVRETSAIQWISGIFLSEEELEQYKSLNTENTDTQAVNTSLIRIASSDAEIPQEGENQPVELIDIAEGSVKGKLLIVHDPKQVMLGISGTFASEPGLQLTEIVKKYNGIAGINAGGFNDEGGSGDGGTPQGLVIYEGDIVWGNESASYNLIGIDSEGILHVGTMSGKDALDRNIIWAVSFVTHDGLASSLIINGEVQTQNFGSGVNPRTAIGQRSDGALILLVLDGRSISTLGATIEDVCSIMLEYGAVNAGNLDGGSSSVMVYEDEIINNCASVTGPRRIPTAFIVLGDDQL
ncbi:MAG: phosphodiester glycosidase family protein [Eubacteriales bacterium]|nr:phosphodiester glycosidase family protein [Eubacteriales bacterium]